MKIIKITLLSILLLVNLNAEELKYEKPGFFDFLYNVGDDYTEVYETSTDPDNLWIWGGLTVSTLLLIKYDKELIDEAQRLGRKWGISQEGESGMKPAFYIGQFPIQFPSDNGSMLYFIGDGITHLSIMSSFFIHGMVTDNDKSLNVSSQLAEGLLDVAIATQTLKHITGRESPFKATTDTGKWRWFPNQEKYHKNVPKYDAFPSGHIATTMMTVTVLAENYPDNPYIRPVGYSLMTLLGFQMMNNGVHWASDYPLGIAIGYTFGKIVSKRERNKAKKGWSLTPILKPDSNGLAMNYKF